MISINRDIFHTDSFCLQCEFYLIKETAWECVLTNSNTEWILQSSALLPLISWIHKCLWIWKTAAGRWSHLPSLHSLWLYFFSCKWLPILVTAMPNFQDRHKSLLLLPSSFLKKLYFILYDKLEHRVMDGAWGWWLSCFLYTWGILDVSTTKLRDSRD